VDAGQSAPPQARPLRADAQANQARIIAAAQVVFAESGTDTSSGRVARRAGVALATLYRRFPSREALVAAAFAEHYAQCQQYLASVEASSAPWPALRSALKTFCAQQVHDRGFTASLLSRCSVGGQEVGRGSLGPEESYLEVEVTRLQDLVHRAHASRALRQDIGLAEIHLLIAGNAGVIAATHATKAAAASGRYVELMLRSFETAATPD
jgi:AcrR family transcriptional regulator